MSQARNVALFEKWFDSITYSLLLWLFLMWIPFHGTSIFSKKLMIIKKMSWYPCWTFSMGFLCKLQPNVCDKWAWTLHSSRTFSCKFLIHIIIDDNYSPHFLHHKRISNPVVPLKVQVFMWSLALGSPMTNDTFQKRRPNSYLCPRWYIMCRELRKL